MNNELAKQLRIAADIEEGKATYGWEFSKPGTSWDRGELKLGEHAPAQLVLNGCQLRIRHKWQDCMDAFERGEKIEYRYFRAGEWSEWETVASPIWDTSAKYEYRIEPKLNHKWQKEKEAYAQGKSIRQTGEVMPGILSIKGIHDAPDWDNPKLSFAIIEDEAKPLMSFPTPPEGEELVTEHEGRQFTPKEFGCPEWRPLLKSEMESLEPMPNVQYWRATDWVVRSYGDGQLCKCDLYRTREPFPQPKPLELLTPGDGREIHNPENLTAEQVGKGYRLLLKEEYGGRHAGHAEFWDNGQWKRSLDARLTYWTCRVPATIPWPPKKEPEYIPLDMEDWLKDGPWGIINQEGEDDESFHLVTQVHVDHITYWDGSCQYNKTHEQMMESKRRNFAGREELCRKPKP